MYLFMHFSYRAFANTHFSPLCTSLIELYYLYGTHTKTPKVVVLCRYILKVFLVYRA